MHAALEPFLAVHNQEAAASNFALIPEFQEQESPHSEKAELARM